MSARKRTVTAQSHTAQAVLQALAGNGGAVKQGSGQASRKLAEIAGVTSTRWLAQVLKSLEDQGVIEREKGSELSRKTYEIRLTPLGYTTVGNEPESDEGPPVLEETSDSPVLEGSGETSEQADNIDYDQLARALLVRAIRAANQPARVVKDADSERRVQQLEEQVRDLGDRLRRLAKERDELHQLLERTQRQRKGSSTLGESLKPEERKLLEELKGKTG